MLDFVSVRQQISEMVGDHQRREAEFAEKLRRAHQTFMQWEGAWESLAAKVERSRSSWLVAELRDALHARSSLPAVPEQLSVACTDGSQIFPDRHEVSSCYLINIGAVSIHYGTGERPVMYSRPTLVHSERELYRSWGGRRTFVNQDIVSIHRTWMEWVELAELLEQSKAEHRTCVGLWDGTLILWSLEGKPRDFQEEALRKFLPALDRLKASGRPVGGYISYPGSRDVVNALRIGLCPEDSPDCDRCSHFEHSEGGEAEPPCAAVEGVTDALLFSNILQNGERSALFGSRSSILERYGGHRICFCYLNVGAEIARLEFPLWVAEDPEKMDLLHAGAYDQAQKGGGYPVALAEAHEKAVVRGGDRELFYSLVRDALVSHDIRIQMSRKSLKKRSIGV